MTSRNLTLSLRILGDSANAVREIQKTARESRELAREVREVGRQANQLDRLQQRAAATSTALSATRDRVRQLSAALAATPTGADGFAALRQGLAATTREANALERAESRLQSRIGLLSTTLRAAGVDTANLAAERRRLGVAEDEAAFRSRRAAARVRTAEADGGPAGSTSGSGGLSAFAAGSRALIGVTAGIAALRSAAATVNGATELDGLNRQLEAVFGSTAIATREFEFAREVSARLGLELQSTARSYAAFSAATIGTRLEGEQARDVFSAVNEAAARLGLSTEQTGGALVALQQIISKGTVQSEELRGQLGERLPGAFQIAARAMGVTTQELGKLLEQGRVTSDEFLPKFAAELRRTFGTDSTTRVESLRSGFARLRSEGGLFAAEFFTPIVEGASGAAGAIASLFKQANDFNRAARADLEDLGNGIVRARSSGALFQQNERGGLVPLQQFDPRDPEAINRVSRGDIRNVVPLAPRPILPDVGSLIPLPAALPDFGPSFASQFEPAAETKRTAELREQLRLVGARTELERAIVAITTGSERNATNAERNLIVELAKARDALRSDVPRGVTGSTTGRPQFGPTAAEASEVLADTERREALKRRLTVETLRAQGNDQAAALRDLMDQYQVWLRELAGDAEGVKIADTLFDAEQFSLRLSEVRATTDSASSKFQAAQSAAAAGLQVGSLSPTEAQRQLATAAQQSIRALQDARAEAERLLNQNPGDSRLTEVLTAANLQLATIAQNARTPFGQLIQSWRDTGAELQQVSANFTEDFADRLTALFTGGKFQIRDFFATLLTELTRVGIQSAAGNLFGGSGIGGLLGGLFGAGGAAAGVPTNFTSGGFGPGTGLQGLASGGPVQRFDETGPIRGPGTATSDSILADVPIGAFILNAQAARRLVRLSNGEQFVAPRDVRRIGRDVLTAINRGPAGIARFAAGGPVQALAGMVSGDSGRSAGPARSGAPEGASAGSAVSAPTVINVDARQAQDPAAVQRAVDNGVRSAFASLNRSAARGLPAGA